MSDAQPLRAGKSAESRERGHTSQHAKLIR